jgi:phage shock protein PspC (stress-responsive transcriptional regulator)
MKKVININLSGRVIPIEETAFDTLKLYIESLRDHFKDEEGRDEIINDIENRIAELLEKETKSGSPCITDQKIEETIRIMGQIDDFIKMDEQESNASSEKKENSLQTEPPRGSLFRNSSDKILGGVCSGIAHALRIDPVVVRILFFLFVLGGGSGIIIYIILWLVLPQKALSENVRKKFFRNQDKKVLGGVASGLASYFNIPVWIPRIVFLLPIIAGIAFEYVPSIIIGGGLGGTFLLTYIILWIVVPYASTSSEKMQMRGEKIDVNSIKNAVKQERQQAPYLKRTRSRLGNILLTLIKIFLIFIGGIIAFACMVTAGALTLAAIVTLPVHDFILSSNLQQWALWGTIVLFLITPVLGIIIWLIRRIIGAQHNKYLSLGFGLLWAMGWISLFTLMAGLGKDFNRESVISSSITGSVADSSTLTVNIDESPITYSKTFWWLKLNEKGFDITEDSLLYNNVNIIVEKSNNDSLSAFILKYSYGENQRAALIRAEHIAFNALFKDSSLLLSSGIGIDKKSKYRGQRVEVIIHLPVGRTIRFDERMIDAYQPFELEDLDDEDIIKKEKRELDYEPGVEYIMTEEGLLPVNDTDKEIIKTANEIV